MLSVLPSTSAGRSSCGSLQVLEGEERDIKMGPQPSSGRWIKRRLARVVRLPRFLEARAGQPRLLSNDTAGIVIGYLDPNQRGDLLGVLNILRNVPVDKADAVSLSLLLREHPGALVKLNGWERHRDMCLVAIKSNGLWLQTIRRHFPMDQEICLEAVRKSPQAIQFVPTSVKGYQAMCLLAVELSRGDPDSLLELMPQAARSDPVICKAAVKTHPSAITSVLPKDDTAYQALCVAAVSRDGTLLRFLPYSSKIDRAVIDAALRSTPEAIRWVSEDAAGYRDLCRQALERDGLLLRWLSIDMQRDAELCAVAVGQNPDAAVYVSE